MAQHTAVRSDSLQLFNVKKSEIAVILKKGALTGIRR